MASNAEQMDIDLKGRSVYKAVIGKGLLLIVKWPKSLCHYNRKKYIVTFLSWRLREIHRFFLRIRAEIIVSNSLLNCSSVT